MVKYGGLILVLPMEHKDNIFLKKSDTGLSKDSVVLTPQIGIVDKSCLVEKVSKLSPAIMLNISAAISDLLAI